MKATRAIENKKVESKEELPSTKPIPQKVENNPSSNQGIQRQSNPRPYSRNYPGHPQEQVQQSYHLNPASSQARERVQPSGYQGNYQNNQQGYNQGNYQGNNQQGYNQGYNRGYYNNHNNNESWRRSQNYANTVPIGSSQNAFRAPPPQHQFNQGQS
jgi:hypothetical protein